MSDSFGARLKHAWNAFMSRDPTEYKGDYSLGPSYSSRPDRVRLKFGNEKSIISALYTRIAMDVAQTTIKHVHIDDNGRLLDVIDSGLNKCLTVEANIDQSALAFKQDLVLSMFDEGCVAAVPVDTTLDPRLTSGYDILSLRTAKVVQWHPRHVRLLLYNDTLGEKKEITLPKSCVALIENPLYAVMNEPNSILSRLIRKLNLLDAVDEQSSSGKLDIIVQLPYTVRTEARRKEADKRRNDIESQLTGSKYGIAYIDGTEHVTQLNRPADNNLMTQIEYLTSMLYSQLGLTQSVFDGTADEKAMANYYSRTIEPITSAISDEFIRKFLSKTARTKNESIFYFRDPFRFVPVSQIAEVADKFTRNEILSSNEVRQIIGLKASDDPKANELRNKNLSESKPLAREATDAPLQRSTEENQNGG